MMQNCEERDFPMHELSIAQDVIRILEQNLKSADLRSVKQVRLSVGKMMAVENVSLKFAYESLTSGTSLADSELEIIEVPVLMRCNSCGKTYSTENPLHGCISCNSADFSIVEGQDMFVKEVVLE